MDKNKGNPPKINYKAIPVLVEMIKKVYDPKNKSLFLSKLPT